MSQNRSKFKKIKKQKNERLYEFGVRLVESFPYALTHEMAFNRINIRSWPNAKQVKISNALDYAAKMGLVRKYRDEHYKAIVFEALKTPHKKDAIIQFNPSNFNKKPQDAIEAISNKRTGLTVSNKRPKKITGSVSVEMNADQFVENLRRLDEKLYERVLDEIGDSIGVGGSWSRNEGNMVYEVEI
mgnify:CR=1 FL=1|jgi:hypothetical protein|tara:strand:- start:395 stop:952 length:558 start_codon:yes stop_codon:yes gene_type:complete